MHDPSIRTDGRKTALASRAQSTLLDKIESKTAVVGIVGLGYVGLPLAVEFARQGFRTVGIDLNSERVLRLQSGENYISDVDEADLREQIESGRLSAEDNYDSSEMLDAVFVCVPTPVTANKDPDVTYIVSAAEDLAKWIRPGQLFVLKSTTFPNTTEGVFLPILEAVASTRGMEVGRDFFLAFSPERIDPGNTQFTTSNTPVVLGGVTPACTEVTTALLKKIVSFVHPVSSPKVAEMEKLLENIFRSVNIALVNELAQLCDRIGGISIWEVVEAAATKPFGYMPFRPGPGLGGHCIPVDPYYLSWYARSHDFETSFITLSARVNEQMPFYVAEAVTRALASQPIRMEDARVLVLGVAFKRDVDDIRHSPSIKLIELLEIRGLGKVDFSDPHVSSIAVAKNGSKVKLESISLTEEAIRSYDVVVIGTDHSGFKYSEIAEQASVLIDTRNALGHVPHSRDKIRLLGGGVF
ncbi:MAG: nucleotide sugar dehydrogenase [Rhodothermia bacterium]